MEPEAWLLYVGLVVGLGGWVVYLYRRREVAVPGRSLLTLLRVVTLAVLLLLVFNPSVPGRPAAGAAGPWVLLDGSLSMTVTAAGETSPWDRAVERARELAEGGARVVLFGEGIRAPETDRDPDGPTFPAFTRSELTPALERAAESGATVVEVISDRRISDAPAARAALDRLGLEVRVRNVGTPVRNAGVERFEVPASVDAGEGLRAEVTFFGTAAAAGDSVTVEVHEAGRPVTSRRVRLPGEGRLGRVEFDVPRPAADGRIRYSAVIDLPDDVHRDDDVRVAYTTVDPESGTLVLLSESPGWEPRFLLPVLERITGLPTRGFLRLRDGRYLVMSAAGAEETVEEAAVGRRAAGAELLVVHGLVGDRAPTWLLRALDASRRSIVFPVDATGARAVGLETGAPAPGEWYASSELPSSPLAGELAGAAFEGLPPLSDVLPVGSADGAGDVPLRVRLRGAGPPEAALVLLPTEAGGRRAVGLARGFWRWAFRSSPGRGSYERLWAGVVGWLLADEPLTGGGAIRPGALVNPPGADVAWTAPGLASERLDLRMARGDSVVFDTTLVVPEDGRFRTPAPAPGSYGWTAETEAVEGETRRYEGRVDVERYTGEMLHPPVSDLAASRDPTSSSGPRPDAGRPLRTHPLPYVLLLGLLSAEWIGRRRRGLR